MFSLQSLSNRKSCYCAFCKAPRKVYKKRNLSLVMVIGLVLLGIVVTYALYHTLDSRGLLFIGVFLLVGEVFSQLRWRASMICRNCGFDPVLYVKEPKAAGLKIKAFLEMRKDSPEHLLRPPVYLPKAKKKGENLSLKV